MPAAQVANIAVYDFGAPRVAASVLKLRLKNTSGGKLDLKFTNDDGEANGIVSVQVSADNSSYAATTAANNLAAVTNVSVPRKTSKEATILLRRDLDLYVQVVASGGCRMQVQMRGDAILEPVAI